MSKILWQPNDNSLKSSAMYRFMSMHGFDNYNDLHHWSITEREKFWTSIIDFCGVRFSKPYKYALTENDGMTSAKWFSGGTLNFAEHLLKNNGDQAAIIFRGEKDLRSELSFDELRNQVASVASYLKKIGLKKNDRVAAFLPNCPEAIIAMLACSSLGIIWSSCSPDFGLEGVVDRFGQISPKLLITANAYLYNGKQYDSLSLASEVVKRIPSIQNTLLVSFVEDENEININVEETSWDNVISHEADLEFIKLPFDHPLYILYSSGTTGAPKCIVHGAGGTLIQHMKEHILHYDINSNDRLFYFTTCGWMMWNWMVSGLAAGATLIIYDGSPFYDEGRILWRIAEEEKISIFGVSAKYISAQEKAKIKPSLEFNLDSLRTLLSTGSPLAPQSFDYVYQSVSNDLQLSSISGGTDIISCFVSGNPILPVRRGELQCLGLGMAVEIYNDSGSPMIEKSGELVCSRAAPCMPIYFWDDGNNEKYHAAYYKKYPGIWCQGDYAVITASNGMIIHGRSDTVLNPGGVRIGTADIYRQVEKLEEVEESIVVGQNWNYDIRVVLFVVLKDGFILDGELKLSICNIIRKNTTSRHVPEKIIQIKEIPRTRSGKIVELSVRNVIHGEEVKNTEALANPESLENFRDLIELQS